MTDLSGTDFKAISALERQIRQSVATNRLLTYAPYRWQQKFHKAGAGFKELMLMAANRVGKTMTAGAEVALHLTGDYDKLPRDLRYPEYLPNGAKHPNAGELVWPNGWEGKRFDHPVLVWTGSPTNETSRDIVQNELLGADLGEALGTGWIPKSRLKGTPTTRQAGVKNVADMFLVKHRTGGASRCILKTYEQGWKKWQGTAPNVVWADEEPDDMMIFSEMQTRTMTSAGILLVTFTPLNGTTDLVEHFKKEGPGVYWQGATWDDAPHLSEEDKAQRRASYRAHEVDARTKGIPMLGEGAVYPVSDESISVQPFAVPDHFARIKAVDFGINHPGAGIELAIDRDQDIIYLIDCYKAADQLAPYHVAWLNKTNKEIPVAWPHDGMNREKTGGNKIADQYRALGANMLGKSARYAKSPREKEEKGGGMAAEPIVTEILERMMTGRFKVFAHLTEWFSEKNSYHRKEGLIVAKRDDIMKATQYGVMMRRFAIPLLVLRAPSRSRARPSAGASVRL